MQNPEWLSGYFEDQLHNLSCYAVSESGRAAGFVSFLLLDWPLKWYLGELALAELPLKRLRLLGGNCDIPDDPAAYDAVFAELATRSDFDCLFFEEVPTESFLWKYLHESKSLLRRFVAYEPEPLALRPILRFEGSFDNYLQKFSAKHRYNIRREIKKLRESPFGEMRLVRYERPDEVSAFVDLAVEISKKTYQWRVHQRGLSATDRVRSRLAFAAQRGWMRCYLLFCGDKPYAFATGYQHEGCFLLDEIGHDPVLSKYSPGTVLQYLLVEDLFAYNRPAVLDLQEYGRYKEVLSTESFHQGKILLFKRRFYSRALIAGDRACRSLTRGASRLLDRWNLKTKVKHMIRNRINNVG